MQKKHLIIGVIIILLSSYYAFKNVSISEVGNALISLKFIYLIPVVFLVLLSYFFRAMRWHFLVSSVKNVKTTRLFSPLMIGFMANMLPARAGEFIRAYLLSKKEDISFTSSFATIFIERLFDMALVLLLLFSVLFFRADFFASGDAEANQRLIGYMVKFGWVSLIGCIFILLFSILLQYRKEWAMKIVNFFTRPLPQRWQDKVISMVHSFSDGLQIIKDRRGFLSTVILSFCIWSTFVSIYYPLYLAFGIENKLPVIPSLVILCLTVAIFITLFPSPGFLGSYQAGCVIALHEVFHIPKAIAASYGIVAWLMAMGLTVVIGIFFAVKDGISFRQLAPAKEEPE